jgi:hypothetical protein
LTGFAVTGGCGDDDDEGQARAPVVDSGRPELTGAACATVSDCYQKVEAGALKGEPLCLDRVRDGYCTHLCTADTDCCAVPGECITDFRQVCSPFESTNQMMCFLSCEDADIHAVDGGPPPADEQEFCQRGAGFDFICRSSGGGSQNRKVCVPGDCGVGAWCATNEDCDPDLECATGFRRGYCTRPAGCTVNADCPANSFCVTHASGQSYCFRGCASDSDCSFCRPFDDRGTCTNQVTFAEAGTAQSVCVPPT